MSQLSDFQALSTDFELRGNKLTLRAVAGEHLLSLLAKQEFIEWIVQAIPEAQKERGVRAYIPNNIIIKSDFMQVLKNHNVTVTRNKLEQESADFKVPDIAEKAHELDAEDKEKILSAIKQVTKAKTDNWLKQNVLPQLVTYAAGLPNFLNELIADSLNEKVDHVKSKLTLGEKVNILSAIINLEWDDLAQGVQALGNQIKALSSKGNNEANTTP